MNVPNLQNLRLATRTSSLRARLGAEPLFGDSASGEPRESDGFSTAQIWGALGVAFAICLTLLWKTGLSVDILLPGNAIYLLAFAGLIVVRITGAKANARWARVFATFAEYVAWFMGAALIGAVSTYPLASLTHGYVDAQLQWMDEALRFDWLAWYAAVCAHPSLQVLGMLSYQCIYVIPAVLLAAFAVQGDRREAHRFLAGFWIAAFITLSLFHWMPAEGPLAYLWHAPLPYTPVSALWQSEIIPTLRTHQETFVNLNQLRGLVCAPSFHAASGTLYIATALRCRPVRWPMVALSAAMLLSTPIEGTHYLTDMIMGSIIAMVSVWLAGVVLDRFGKTTAEA